MVVEFRAFQCVCIMSRSPVSWKEPVPKPQST